MKHYLAAVFALLLFALLIPASALAQTQKKMVIALETDDFTLAETDISTLAIGEAKTIETDSGKIIDILRTSEGAEIYVDGELVEMNSDHESLHHEHLMNMSVEIICDSEEECDEDITILNHDDLAVSGWTAADGQHVVIHKEVEVICNGSEQGNHCNHEVVMISGDEGLHMEQLHENHENGDGHKVIVIKKTLVTED